jgi:hypothetical protein
LALSGIVPLWHHNDKGKASYWRRYHANSKGEIKKKKERTEELRKFNEKKRDHTS